MFTTSTPTAPPTLSTAAVSSTHHHHHHHSSSSNAVSPPTSPTRPSRLRGLSYLRNYTQNLHNRSESDSSARQPRPAFPRARSQPSPDSAARANNGEQTSTSARAPPQRRAPSPPGGNSNSTNGWVPTSSGGGGNNSDGSTRATRIRQQSTTSSHEAATSGPAQPVTTAESINTPATATARTMTRSRADTAGAVLTVRNPARSSSADNNNNQSTGVGGHNPLPSIRFIPHFDPRANRPSLSFPAITRTLPGESHIIKVGRYSERENAPEIAPNVASSAPVGFKSKVVSRRHCEFWSQNNQWYVKDVKSSSGTFLNHVRLSPPGQESRAFAVNDGDVVQLGIDFRGGEEMIFRCVKIRIECNRGWQKHLNNFNKKTHKNILNRSKPKPSTSTSTKDSDTASVNSSECSICLMSISPCQSLFVAPCSHVWHYKCIRPILNGHTWPNFLCPNCRAVADLEADVDEEQEDDDNEDWEDDAEVMEASRKDATTGAGAEAEGGMMTPRALRPVDTDSTQGGGADGSGSGEDDLADIAAALSLTETHTDAPPPSATDMDTTQIASPSPFPFSSTAEPSETPSAPRTIPGSAERTRHIELTPGVGLIPENVLTPRNDIGPFVLDGDAGRSSVNLGGRRSEGRD